MEQRRLDREVTFIQTHKKISEKSKIKRFELVVYEGEIIRIKGCK